MTLIYDSGSHIRIQPVFHYDFEAAGGGKFNGHRFDDQKKLKQGSFDQGSTMR
jgi:hypothetical protein